MTLSSAVVIPSYGRPELLREALASVRAQTRPAREVIVVDDGNTAPLQIPRTDGVRVIRHESNEGPSAARNSGLRASSSDVIFFLDDDDLYESERIERAIRCHEDGAEIVTCWTRLDHEVHPKSGRTLRGNVYDSIADAFTPSMGATSVLRGACPYFDTSLDYGEDIDWWIRASRGASVETVPHHDYVVRPFAGHRGRTEHQRRAELSERLIDFHKDYLEAHPTALAFRFRRLGHYRWVAGDRRGSFMAHLREALLARSVVPLGRAVRGLMLQPPGTHASG